MNFVFDTRMGPGDGFWGAASSFAILRGVQFASPERIPTLQTECARLNAWNTELSSDLPFIEADQSLLHQVISNLVQNAIEAMGGMTDRDRVLQVKTDVQSQNSIIVAVKDTGPGLDPKRMDNVFDAFVTTKSNGIGLGLAISRMIVERHGGKLNATSDGKSGALFQVVLPISRGTSYASASS
jgi:signal transduction histidine kinase